jgi:mannosyltransferase
VRSAAADIHPPGYYLALKVWTAAAGNTELALRGFSALAGLVGVALLYRLGKEYFGPGAGVAAALVGAFNPFLIYYSQEARMYALLATLSAVSFLLFSLWLRSSRPPAAPGGDRRLGLAYSLVSAAGLYTHYAFGFVLLAQNVAALGGLLAHGRARAVKEPAARAAPANTRRGRLLAWIGWQALALVLYLPWLPAAIRQLTTWPAGREFQPLSAALLDLGRYLAFGRTLPTTAALAGLAGAAVLLLFGLRRRGQTITPLLWLLLPAGLTLAFGLLSEAFAKFLLVAVPAVCLLLGQGLAALPVGGGGRSGVGARGRLMGQGGHTQRSASVLAQSPPSQTPPNGTRTTQHVLVSIALTTLWLAASGAFAAGTFASLNNLYFNLAYFRDDYRGIARYVEGLARPGDALITIAPNQVGRPLATTTAAARRSIRCPRRGRSTRRPPRPGWPLWRNSIRGCSCCTGATSRPTRSTG